MVTQKHITLPPMPRGYHLITRTVLESLDHLPEAGLLHVLIQHTSAGLTLNENADPSVRDDFETFINHLVPENHPLYSHVFEGSDDTISTPKKQVADTIRIIDNPQSPTVGREGGKTLNLIKDLGFKQHLRFNQTP